jgi:hypothetical protein
LVWVIDGAAELVVAYRENRTLGQISGRAWTVLLTAFVAGMYALGFFVEMLP